MSLSVRNIVQFSENRALLSPLLFLTAFAPHAYADELADTDLVLERQTIVLNRQADDPGALAIIPADIVNGVGNDHAAEVLNTVPGVNIQMNSGQEHLIAIRSPVLTGGAGQGSFLVMLDGVPVRAPAFGNVNALFEIPYETAEAIEVVRGPGSAKYGSNAVHGVINVLSRDPSDEARYGALSYSSLDRTRFNGVYSSQESDIDWMVAGTVLHDSGWREDSGGQQQKLTARVAGEAGAWDWVGAFDAFNLTQETAGFIQGFEAYLDDDIATSNPNPEAFRDAWTARSHVRLSRAGENNQLTIIPFALTQRMIFRQHFLPYKGLEKNGHDSAGVLTRFEFEQDFIDWTIGADLQIADGFLKETQNAPFGFFPGDSRFPVGTHYDYEVETISTALFAESRIAITDSLKLLAGLRFEDHQYDYSTNADVGVNGRFNVPDDRTDSFDLLTPKLGVIWTSPQNISIYANYSRGERAPQASDLYRLQSLQTVDDIEVETNDSIEIGARGTLFSMLDFEISAYSMEKSNFFFRDADGLNEPNGETDHTGVELFLSMDNETGWNWDASISYGDHTYAFNRDVGRASDDISSGDKVDTAPEWLASTSLGYVWSNTSVFWNARYVDEYYLNPANTAEYEGHLVHDLKVTHQLNDNWKADLIVKNVTDEDYADRADFAFGNYRYFPGEPLNLVVGIRTDF